MAVLWPLPRVNGWSLRFFADAICGEGGGKAFDCI